MGSLVRSLGVLVGDSDLNDRFYFLIIQFYHFFTFK